MFSQLHRLELGVSLFLLAGTGAVAGEPAWDSYPLSYTSTLQPTHAKMSLNALVP